MRGQGYRHDNPTILLILLVTAVPGQVDMSWELIGLL